MNVDNEHFFYKFALCNIIFSKMKQTIILFITAVLFTLCSQSANAQKRNKPYEDIEPLPHKVENLNLMDLNNKPCTLPYFGEKNLLIFYVDPDKHKQNDAFVRDMEETGKAAGDNIVGFGIIDLKNTLFPNSIVRALARWRTEKNKATIITDPQCIVAKEWGLGDCNNKFTIMLVSKEGELVFFRKGEFTEEDQAAFYDIIDNYR